MRIFTPCNKVKLEDVFLVVLKKNGKKLEIACHINKLSEYQNSQNQNHSGILQTEAVFLNVSRGLLAKKEDLQAAFGHTDTQRAIEEILQKGTVQFSQKERVQQREKMQKEIAFMISRMSVNPQTGLPHPQATIERAMKEAQVSIDLSKNQKPQAVKILQIISHKNILAIEKEKEE